MSTFHVSVMASTPAIAIHNVRHPSLPSNFSAFMASQTKSCRDLGGGEGWRGRGHGAKNEMKMSECGSIGGFCSARRPKSADDRRGGDTQRPASLAGNAASFDA